MIHSQARVVTQEHGLPEAVPLLEIDERTRLRGWRRRVRAMVQGKIALVDEAVVYLVVHREELRMGCVSDQKRCPEQKGLGSSRGCS